MFLNRLSAVTLLSLLSIGAFGQNTNNGVIINNTVIISDPVYVAPTYQTPAPNEVDRAQEKVAREMEARRYQYYSNPYVSNFEKLEKSEVGFFSGPRAYTNASVNMRSKGGTEAPIIERLPEETELIVLSRTADCHGWTRVYCQASDKIGFIHPRYLRVLVR